MAECETKREGSAAVPEHLATRRREPRSLSLIVMKSFKPSGLNEPVKRYSTPHFYLETASACAASLDTNRGKMDVCVCEG